MSLQGVPPPVRAAQRRQSPCRSSNFNLMRCSMNHWTHVVTPSTGLVAGSASVWAAFVPAASPAPQSPSDSTPVEAYGTFTLVLVHLHGRVKPAVLPLVQSRPVNHPRSWHDPHVLNVVADLVTRIKLIHSPCSRRTSWHCRTRPHALRTFTWSCLESQGPCAAIASNQRELSACRVWRLNLQAIRSLAAWFDDQRVVFF